MSKLLIYIIYFYRYKLSYKQMFRQEKKMGILNYITYTDTACTNYCA